MLQRQHFDRDLRDPRQVLVDALYSEIDTRERYVIYGIAAQFTRVMLDLNRDNISLVERQKLLEQNNRLHSGGGKPMDLKAKSQQVNSAHAGRVHVTEEDFESLKENCEYIFDAERNLHTYKNKTSGKEIYFTDELQDLKFIRTQIAAGKYKVVDNTVELHIDADGKTAASMIISDNEGKLFKIELNKNSLVNVAHGSGGMLAKVKDLANIFNRPAGNIQKKQKIMGPSQQEKTQQSILENLFKSDFFIDNLDNMAKIVPVKPLQGKDGKLTYEDDPARRIVCNANAIPIRGDVDLFNELLPDNLPLVAYKMIGTVSDGDSDIQKLQNGLQELKRGIEAQGRVDEAYYEYLSQAIAKLDAASEADKKAMVKSMGVNITIFNAALVLALGDELQHGSDAFSPIAPENITALHIPSKDGKHYATFGEFDYWAFFILNDIATENKLMDFNPCWFVPCAGKAGMWRNGDDVKFTDLNNRHRTYNNKADEAASIQMSKLVFEKQFLLYAQTHTPQECEKMLQVYEANMQNMIKLTEAWPYPQVAADISALQKAGLAVARDIMNNIRENIKNNRVEARLQEISGYFEFNTLLPKQAPLGSPIIISRKAGDMNKMLAEFKKQIIRGCVNAKEDEKNRNGYSYSSHPD